MSDKDKDKYVSEISDYLEKATPFLKRIDGFIYKHWKTPFFFYFVIAFLITLSALGGNTAYEAIFKIVEWAGSTWVKTTQMFNDLLFLWSPIIITLVWIKIFHPKD